MPRESYILLSDFAKSNRLTEEQARNLLKRAENIQFYKAVNGKELVSTLFKIDNKPKEENSEKEREPYNDYKQEIDSLRQQLIEAQQTIIEKDAKIEKLTDDLAEMAKKVSDITDKALTTINQQQILTAMTTKKIPWYKRLLGQAEKGL